VFLMSELTLYSTVWAGSDAGQARSPPQVRAQVMLMIIMMIIMIMIMINNDDK